MSGVERTVVGTCSAVEQKPGSEWMRFMVDVEGDKYPQRLDTRDEDVIAAAKSVGANVATWTFNEVESDKINPRSNKPYINKYLEGVEPGGVPGTGSVTGGGGGGGGNGGAKQYTPEEIERFDERERRDYRSRAWGQTLGAWEHTIKADDDPILIFEKLKPFQRKVYEDIARDLAKTEPEPSALSPADDDIPF